MKNLIIILSLLFINNVFSQNITLQGNLENCNARNIYIKTFDQKIVGKDKINNGKFSIKTELNRGYYTLTIGNNSASIYLITDDELTVSADLKDFTNTLKFTGKGSERNNFLINKQRLNSKRKANIEEFYVENESLYLRNVQNLMKDHRINLSNGNFDEFFVKDESKNLDYSFLLSIFNFKHLQKFYFEREVTPSNMLLNMTRNIDFNDVDLYKKYPYYRYLAQSKWKKDIDNLDSYLEMNTTFYKIKSQSLQNDVFISFIYSISKNEEKSEIYYDLVKNNTSNPKVLDLAKKQFKAVSKTKTGSKSPSFEYKDINGKEVKLKDLKGKLVYIDVWATWCGPCLDQIPALKKLEHDYKNKDVVFVSISVDGKKDFDKWKSLVKLKELKGIQLFADNSFDSKFIKSYGISTIPTFILLDKKGRILERRTSKPSTDNIRKKLDKYLKD
ncbi:MAG: TlpA family protein disulfide reductase [Polaribacter sp.]